MSTAQVQPVYSYQEIAVVKEHFNNPDLNELVAMDYMALCRKKVFHKIKERQSWDSLIEDIYKAETGEDINFAWFIAWYRFKNLPNKMNIVIAFSTLLIFGFALSLSLRGITPYWVSMYVPPAISGFATYFMLRYMVQKQIFR